MSYYKIGDIQPNPFQNFDRLSIQRNKIEALRESLRTTGYWDTIVARMVKGKPQIAYGHHLLVAMEEEWGKDHKIKLNIRDLDDEAMLKIMTRENMEERNTDAQEEQRLVQAVVENYAKGIIRLPEPPSKTKEASKRYAPSFVTGDDGDAARPHPYTAQEVADFTGRTEPNGRPKQEIKDALAALEFIELGFLADSDFEGLSVRQGRAVVEETRKIKRRYEKQSTYHRGEIETLEAVQPRPDEKVALIQKSESIEHEEAKIRETIEDSKRMTSMVAKGIGDLMRSNEIGYRDAAMASKEITRASVQSEFPEHLDAYTEYFITRTAWLFDPESDNTAKELKEIIKHKDDLDPLVRENLVATLKVLEERIRGHRMSLVVEEQEPHQDETDL